MRPLRTSPSAWITIQKPPSAVPLRSLRAGPLELFGEEMILRLLRLCEVGDLLDLYILRLVSHFLASVWS